MTLRRLTWMSDDAFGNARGVPVELLVVPLSVGDDERRALTALLSTDERRRADSFVFDRDRRRFIVVHARLRQFVAERTGACPESVRFTTGRHGKPEIADRGASTPRGSPMPDLRFSLSHCGELAAFAFAVGREVGIDIEHVRPMRDADATAERFFSPRERGAYRALEARERPQAFFNCWTRKEAFMKAVGEGLAMPLDSFDVTLAPGEPARLLRVGELTGETCGWRMEGFVPEEGFVGAMVVEELASSSPGRH